LYHNKEIFFKTDFFNNLKELLEGSLYKKRDEILEIIKNLSQDGFEIHFSNN